MSTFHRDAPASDGFCSPASLHATHLMQEAIAEALLGLEAPIPPELVGPDRRSSEVRFGVYRNNVVSGLINVLKAAFPVVARLVGDEFFSATARLFVTTHPPHSPIMLCYGGEFPEFLAGFEPAASVPYIADVASLERAWLNAYHAAEAPSLLAREMLEKSASQLMSLRFRLHPSLGLVRSPFPVLSVWEANADGNEPSWIDLDSGAQDVLVVRSKAEVEMRLVPPGGAAFIDALASGLTSIEALNCALAENADFDLASTFAGLFAAGGVSEVQVSPPENQ